jgi:sugar lactone lactonase YvrE
MAFKTVRNLLLISVLIALLAACGGEEATPEPTSPPPTATAVPTETPPPTDAPEPSATPPPTETPQPEPTATSEPTATPEAAEEEMEEGEMTAVPEGFVAFESAENGLALAHPEGWVTDDSFFLTLASDPAMLAEGTTGLEEGAIAILIPGPVADLGSSDPIDILNEAAGEMGLGEGIAMTSEPEAVEIQGQPAAIASLVGDAEDGTELQVRMASIVAGERAVIVMAVTPTASAETYMADLEAVINSVQFIDVAEAGEEQDETATGEVIRQWAIDANASTQYSEPAWSAMQATGAPDTSECGDIETAWASSSSMGEDWLELTYAAPVTPTEVNIYQTYEPNQVVMVELIDTEGDYHKVYSGEPAVEDCPFTLTVPVDDADYQAMGVRVSLDQSILSDLSWNEIDAVELVGFGSAAAAEVMDETEEEMDDDLYADFETPPGFLWRVGGESDIGEGGFSALGGMDTDAAGNLYVADNIHGVYIFDSEGNQVGLIDHDDFNNPADVKVGPEGNVHVASWGADQVFVFTPEGELITQFGEEGTEEGQFGLFSPQALAVGQDGAIYVHDENEDAAEESYERIQIFSPDGAFVDSFIIEEDFFALSGMDVGPNGNLYLVGFIGDSILEYTPDGELVGELGTEAIDFAGAQGLSIDDAGNFYVTTWSSEPAIKLDAEGNQVGGFGVDVEEGEIEWPGGAFYQTQGIAVARDGTAVYVSDWSGDYSFVTAFQFE